MERSRACVSVEVKQVIGALCRLLAAAGVDAVPAPETFRRAKFGGGPEVEDQFWQLLASILKKTSTDVPEESAHLTGDAENRKWVAAGLWQAGCHATWMYGRRAGEGGEGGEGERPSGTDLLLALGWLLAAGALEKLLTRRAQQLDRTPLTPVHASARLSPQPRVDPASLRRLQWLVGKLRRQGWILLSMLDERTRLLHAVFSASLASTAPSSSEHSSAALKDDCVCMRQLCDLLQAYLNWKQVENVFWTWMDSVVDCCPTRPVPERPTHTPGVCHHGNWGLEQLQNMLLSLPTAQPCRARLQVERPARRLCAGAEDVGELPAPQAVRLLLQTEALLLERRDKQRLAHRLQLQEVTAGLDELVLIPP